MAFSHSRHLHEALSCFAFLPSVAVTFLLVTGVFLTGCLEDWDDDAPEPQAMLNEYTEKQ